MDRQIQFQNHVGEMLTGTLHQPEQVPVGAVVAGHCFTCSRHTGILRHICKDLSSVGFMALRFDFSGNGQSQGLFEETTLSKQILEMETAVELMEKKGAKWIGLVGHSLGAAIALLTARRTDSISAICRVAGRLNNSNNRHFLTPEQTRTLTQIGQVKFVSRGRTLTLPMNYFKDLDRYDLKKAMQSLDVPTLVVHGDQDEIIPVSEAHLAKSNNPDKVELFIVPGGNHMLSGAGHPQQVGRTVAAWFRRQAGFPLPE